MGAIGRRSLGPSGCGRVGLVESRFASVQQDDSLRTIAVIGAGAVGGAVAAALADAGTHDLRVCVRRPVGGLEVRHADGTVVRTSPTVLSDPAQTERADLVLLATKAYQSEGTAPWLDRLAGPGTIVAVLQNGIDQVARIQPLAPHAEIVPVVVMLAAEVIEPGVIVQSSIGLLEVPDTEAGRRVADAFEGSAVRVDVLADFTTRAWRKLLLNAVIGAVGALTVRDLTVLADQLVFDAALALADEVIAVGRAEGATFAPDAAVRALERAQRSAPGHWSSIAVDRREGRPLEWEVRNAVIGRLGRRHGIPTPLNDLVTALLQACDPR